MIIGIPVKDDYECFKQMIETLLPFISQDDKIIVIDGLSNDGTGEFLEYWAKMDKRVRVYNGTSTPLKAYNMLFELAKAENEDLFLTQSDVLFPQLYNRNFLQEMKEIAKHDRVGAITCLNGGGVSGEDYVDGLYWLGGWCTYIPNRTIQKLGGYDEGFPNGFGVDIDYTYRILKENLGITSINYWVDHHQANTRAHDTDPDAEKMKKESSLYFKKKHGLQN